MTTNEKEARNKLVRITDFLSINPNHIISVHIGITEK